MLVEFGETIDEATNARVRALARAMQTAALDGIDEIVPTYRSLLVRFDPDRLDRAHLRVRLEAGLATAEAAEESGRHWRVPVVYGGDFGADFDDFAAHHGLTRAELVLRHTGPVYRVAMIGFQPGFAYLSGLDPSLARSRRSEPRARTPAGSVSIGGAQAAIASVEAPSGWHLLGRTPARLFMPGREPAFLLAAGDRVSFTRVPADAWPALDAKAEAGEPVAELLA